MESPITVVPPHDRPSGERAAPVTSPGSDPGLRQGRCSELVTAAGAAVLHTAEDEPTIDLPGLLMQHNEPVHVKAGHRARDQRQQRDASGRCLPDPAICLSGHGCPLRTSSPMIAGMYVPGDSFLGHPDREIP